jgi:exonuclease SbcD
MKILHTADWHLGRKLEGCSRHDEQVPVLDDICRIADEEAVDVVVIAGDLFDSYNPPAESEALCYRTLTRLSHGGRRAVVAIAGNHDSPDRLLATVPYAHTLGISVLGFPHTVPLLYDYGSDASACVEAAPSFLRLRTATGELLSLLALPYPSESRLGEVLSDEIDDEELVGRAYSGRVARFLASSAQRFTDDGTNLITSHLFVAGGFESDSERPIQAGGAYVVPPECFPTADYVALGHLHRPQEISAQNSNTPIRYSGSILQYSFSEAGQKKSVTIVESDHGNISHRSVPLPSGRALERWTDVQGLEELEARLADADPQAWLSISVRLDQPIEPDYMARLRSQHPGILTCMPEYQWHDIADNQPSIEDLPLEEQFRRFIRHRFDEPPSDEVVRLFLELAASGE